MEAPPHVAENVVAPPSWGKQRLKIQADLIVASEQCDERAVEQTGT